jgi:hypothetical protein
MAISSLDSHIRELSLAVDKGQRTMIFSVKGRREKVRRKTEKIPTKVRKKNVWQKIFFQTHFEQK